MGGEGREKRGEEKGDREEKWGKESEESGKGMRRKSRKRGG